MKNSNLSDLAVPSSQSSLIRSTAFGFALVALAAMQATSAAASSADADWQSLQALVQTSGTAGPASIKSAPDQKVTPALFQVGRSHQASLDAAAFYTKYPNDIRAVTARRLEIIAAIQSVQLGGQEFKDDALAAAAAFRGNPRNTADDRFSVALAMESAWPSDAGGSIKSVVSAKVADRLHTEFGDIPAVYHLYAEIIKTATPTIAAAVAAEILKFPNAPAWARAHAQGVVDRSGLIGRVPIVSLINITGKILSLGDLSGKMTVLYFWDRFIGASQLTVLSEYKSQVPANTRWIYIGLGNTGMSTADAKIAAPLPGEFLVEPKNLPGPVARAFKVPGAPFICILDRTGKLQASGSVDQISMLFASVNP